MSRRLEFEEEYLAAWAGGSNAAARDFAASDPSYAAWLAVPVQERARRWARAMVTFPPDHPIFWKAEDME